MKQKPRIEDLTIKPELYRYGLRGINYKYFQYGSVKRVDVFNCGVAYDFDGTIGCYYNKQVETRAITCGYAVRTKDGGTIARANSNEVDDLTAISPIMGVYHDSGNTNVFTNIKVESLGEYYPHPTVDPNGLTVTSAGRWVLKVTRGTGSKFEKFRSEFDGNLVSLGDTYGNFLRDFYCNYNGVSGSFITLQETPSSTWQTNNLDDVELGFSSPNLTHEYYSRKSRLGQKITLPPQIAMTLRDTAGAPATGEKGLIRMDANARLWVATAINSFEKVAYETTATSSIKGQLMFHKNSTTLTDVVIPSEGGQTVSIFMTGLQNSDSIMVSTTMTIPNGFTVYPAKVEAGTGYARVTVYNRTTGNLTLPAGTWNFTYVRAT